MQWEVGRFSGGQADIYSLSELYGRPFMVFLSLWLEISCGSASLKLGICKAASTWSRSSFPDSQCSGGWEIKLKFQNYSFWMFFCTIYWYVSTLFLDYFELRKWPKHYKKKVYITKMKELMFFYKLHFFKSLCNRNYTWKSLKTRAYA